MNKKLTRADINQEMVFDAQTVCPPITVAAKGQVDLQSYAKSGTPNNCFDAIREEIAA